MGRSHSRQWSLVVRVGDGGGFEETVFDLCGHFDFRVDGIDDSNEDGVVGFDDLLDGAEGAETVRLAGHLQVEAACRELKEIGEQRCIVYVGRVSRVVVAAGADVDADALTLGGSKAVEHLVVEVDEGAEETTGGSELKGESGFGEVDLDGVSAG